MFSHKFYWTVSVSLLSLLLISFFSVSLLHWPKRQLHKHRADFVTLLLQNDGTCCQQNIAQKVFVFFFQLVFLNFVWFIPKAWYSYPWFCWADMNFHCTLLLWSPLCPGSFIAWNKCHPLFQSICVNPLKIHLRCHFLCEAFFEPTLQPRLLLEGETTTASSSFLWRLVSLHLYPTISPLLHKQLQDRCHIFSPIFCIPLGVSKQIST